MKKALLVLLLSLFITFPFSAEESAIDALPFEGNAIIYENEELRVEFSRTGAKIKAFYLKNYEDSKKEGSYNLLPPETAAYPLEIEGSGIKGINSVEYDHEMRDNNVLFISKIGDIIIEKEYIFQPGTYFLQAVFRIINESEDTLETDYIQMQWGPQIYAPGLSKTMTKRYAGAVFNAEGKVKNKALGKKDLELVKTQFKWMGYNSLYFAMVIFKSPEMLQGEIFKTAADDVWVSAVFDKSEIDPGETTEYSFKAYAGPKSTKILKAHGEDLEELVSMGFFGFLTKIIIGLLKTIYNVIPNYGLAIILITLLIKLLLLPLSTTSIKSMKKMAKLQPELKKLQKMYKDNPQKLNEETMKLYKIFKVNPMSGCLPVLVQLPFFWAIYSAFSVSIELRGAGFIWWIKDLASPDTVGYIFGFPINIMPILMGAAMLLQQEIQGTQQSKSEATKYMKFMPIMFLVFFWNMPSALVLYWLTNNILSIIQTLIVYRQNDK